MGLQVQENVVLAPFTTLGVGGPARFFAEVDSEQQLIEALAFARQHHLPLFPLGGGSNLLVADEAFPGLVVHLTITFPVEIFSFSQYVDLRVPAGLDWDALVLRTCEMGLSGMECLAGIPGLTGGAPIQNIGAYGQEVSQTIRSVRAYDTHAGGFVELANEDCRFSYRSSLFNSSDRGRYLVTAVTFRLRKDAKPDLSYGDLTKHFGEQQPTPIEVYRAVREIRRSKGMLLIPEDPDCRSAGSFFKNPVITAEQFVGLQGRLGLDASQIPHWPSPGGTFGVKLAAAWLIERAGFRKGFALGEAGISSRHTLALINRGKATYENLTALRDKIRSDVASRFDIVLEQEPVELGQPSAGRISVPLSTRE